ncbi:MAG: methyl-accepting chemotaxis protein [Roseobacter sp.]
MNVMNKVVEAENEVSLDKSLNAIRDDLAAARVAAMQVIIFNMQLGSEDTQYIQAKEFMQAIADIKRAETSLKEIETRHLKPLGLELPDALGETKTTVSRKLAELTRILDRCTLNENDDLQGFQPTTDMYDLCCCGVAKGLNTFSAELAGFFLELTEKAKIEKSDTTSNIASEIGKIGRVINMVATNASIEAARVGDAGKGFTVIADEVKTLSSRVSSLSVSLTERLS